MMNLPGEAITVTSQTRFYEAPLVDGDYEIRFVLTDFLGLVTYSAPFLVSIDGDAYDVDLG